MKNQTNRTLRKILSIALCLALVMSYVPMVSITAGAAATDITVTIDTGASVTLRDADGDDYYDIGTADELYAFAVEVNSGNTSINGELTADIVLNENLADQVTVAEDGTVSADASVRKWTPMGYIYNGTFDGGNHTITGLYSVVDEGGTYGGLIEWLDSEGTVKNLKICDFCLEGNYSGAIAGHNEGKIIGCSISGTGIFDGSPELNVQFGGIVFENLGQVTDCSISANLSLKGAGEFGGIAHTNYYGTVTGCSNSGTLTGTEYVGGIVSFNSGTVTGCSNSGTVSGTEYVGGIVSFNSDTVTGCYNTGTVSGDATGDSSYAYVGGIAGYDDGTVSGCYNAAAVSGDATGDYSYTYVGGIAGYGFGTVSGCYNIGSIDSGTYSGGIIAAANGTFADCYYLDTCVKSGSPDYSSSEGITEKTSNHFASGEVAYLLNGDQSTITFKQTLGTDAYPSFTGGTVYQVKNCKEENDYSNTNENIDHQWVNGTCTVCDLVCDHTIENHVCTDCGAMEIVVSFNAGDYEWKTGDTLYFCRISGDNEWEEYVFTATVAEDGTVTWTPDKTLCWDGTGEHKLVVRYPNTSYVWDIWCIDEDQSTPETLRKNDRLDAIWSGNPTTDTITFNLKHRMAKVTVNYEAAEGVTVSKAEVYTLTQYMFFDTNTLERVDVAWEEGYDLWINSYLGGDQFTAFVSPDAYAADGNFIKITLSDGSVREVKMNKAVTFEEGAEYTYKVIITSNGAYLTCADECTFEYIDNGDGTHDKVCGECGYVEVDNEAHTPAENATCTTLAVCDTCGKEYGELAAHTPDTNGKCTVDGCGYQYAAKVGDSFYETIHKALRVAEGINGCTLTLLDDATLTSMSSYASYVNTGTFTLDLNGKTLSSNKRTLEVMGSADLTIRDSIGGGKIVSTGSSAVYLSGGKLNIESGTFEGSLDGVFLSGSSTLTVKGGTFTGSRAMITGFGSNCVIDLTNIDPAGFTLKNNGSGTFAPKLPEGYGMVGSDGKLLTSLSAEQSATVHKHEYKYTDLGDGNHQQACSCGLTTGEPAAHSTTAEDDKAATCVAPAYCSVCDSEYGDVDKTNHDSSVEYENGFCPYCGIYEPAELNEDNYYEISNAGQLFWFANYINTVDRTANAVLTADIDLEGRLWTPIGSTGENSHNFRGIFDGQNHTIKGLYVEGGRAGLGFFGEVRTGTVKNFTIYGEVVANTDVNYVGGVIGSICGLNGDNDLERNGAIIQNITSYVNLTAETHGIGMIGGFVGYANHESLIENCSWYGTFDAGEYRVDSGAGGFIGKIQENTSRVTIRNCGAYGTIKTNYAKNSYNNTATIYMGGFLSFSNTGAQTTLENCLFAGKFECGENLTDEARLGAFGTLRSVNAIKNCYYLGDDGLEAVHSDSDLKPGSDNVEITSVTKEQLKSGEVAYLLGEAWGQVSNTEGSLPIITDNELYKVVTVGETGNYSVANVGDTNGDGTVDVTDYQALVNKALADDHEQIETASYDDIVKYDLDGDGYLDVIDAYLLHLFINGFTTVDVYAVGDYDLNGVAFEEADILAMAEAITEAMDNPKTLATYEKYACDLNADGKVSYDDLNTLTSMFPLYFVGEA